MKQLMEKFKAGKLLPALFALALLGAGVFLLLPAAPASTGMTEEELRISRTLSSIQGAGDTLISIHYADESPTFGTNKKTPTGAVIVSRGANDLSVRLHLMEAAQALLGLNIQNIAVLPMEDAP